MSDQGAKQELASPALAFRKVHWPSEEYPWGVIEGPVTQQHRDPSFGPFTDERIVAHCFHEKDADTFVRALNVGPKLLAMLQRYDQLNYSPCRLDHNGDCQEHFMENDGEGCTVKLGRDLLDEIKGQVGGAS